MDAVGIWNQLGYFDGIMFTIWLGVLYYGKCWIDSKFKQWSRKNLIKKGVFLTPLDTYYIWKIDIK